jgi:hypothetical protein
VLPAAARHWFWVDTTFNSVTQTYQMSGIVINSFFKTFNVSMTFKPLNSDDNCVTGYYNHIRKIFNLFPNTCWFVRNFHL